MVDLWGMVMNSMPEVKRTIEDDGRGESYEEIRELIKIFMADFGAERLSPT